MNDIVTFGEAMIRLSPPDCLRLEQTSSLEAAVGGAELSVAAGVSRLGLKSAWVSRLPANPLGRMIVNKGREFGVDMSQVIWAEGERAGLYFVEYGSAPRPTQVFYDRSDSAFARIKPGMLDWPRVLANARLLHLGGITPALSPSSAQVQKEALIAARQVGCLVSYDINYRAALWKPEQARAAQLELMEYVDILITSLPPKPGMREIISGLSVDDVKDSPDNPCGIAKALIEHHGFKAVMITMRATTSAQRTMWSSIALIEDELYQDKRYEIESVDQLGGGDACVAGFLTGLLEGHPEKALQLGNAFSALTQTTPTDFPWPTRDEVETLIAGGQSQLLR